MDLKPLSRGTFVCKLDCKFEREYRRFIHSTIGTLAVGKILGFLGLIIRLSRWRPRVSSWWGYVAESTRDVFIAWTIIYLQRGAIAAIPDRINCPMDGIFSRVECV